MYRPRENLCSWSAFALLLWTLNGCQSYRPQPIDVEQIQRDWHDRDARGVSATLKDMLATKVPAGFDLGNGVSLREAQAVLLFFNPSLRVLRQQTRLPAVAAEYAAEWRDPDLELDGSQILANVSDRLLWGGTLGITIPLSGRPALAQRLANSQAIEAEAALLGAEWALLKELQLEWTHYSALVAEIALIEQALADLEPLVEASARFKAAQAMTVLEERLLLLQEAQGQEQLLAVKAQRTARRLRVIALLGLSPQHDWQLQPEMPATADRPTLTAVADHPRVRAALAAYTVAEQSVELEIRRQYPDVRIGLGAGDETGDSRLLFGLDVLPIPIWNRNRGAIATSIAQRRVAAAAVEEALLTQQLRITQGHARVLAAIDRRRFLEERLAPLANAQLQDARRSTASGDLNLVLLTDAVERALSARRELLRARAEEGLATLALQTAVGPFSVPLTRATTSDSKKDQP
ncbi:MAG: TolC family protein [Planctomycetota bacterium]